jgi:hypothetical protein
MNVSECTARDEHGAVVHHERHVDAEDAAAKGWGGWGVDEDCRQRRQDLMSEWGRPHRGETSQSSPWL